jgi:hypothetical protein
MENTEEKIGGEIQRQQDELTGFLLFFKILRVIYRQTHRQQGDLISLLFIFQNKLTRL